MPASRLSRLLLLAVLAITAMVYWPGLRGAWLFDDFPNIVDNHDIQPANASVAALVNAALSSPASEFKRPLASLSFALNFLTAGLDPYWMKLTNLGLHLLNGLLVYLLARRLLLLAEPAANEKRASLVPLVVAAGWMLAPINLTAVLYVVQRMENMANLFVLLGLLGYLAGRQRMLRPMSDGTRGYWTGFTICALSITLPAAVGLLAKETAVMLPLYALTLEWVLLGFRNQYGNSGSGVIRPDWRLAALYLLVLVVPMAAGLAYLLPHLLDPQAWATRDFTMRTRLLSEARVVLDYLRWTLLPTPESLSFYHDDFQISTSLIAPWTTLASMLGLASLAGLAIWLRTRRPLIALGILWFLGCHLLTATILPLELVYEHRNYFASFGVMLAAIPLLVPRGAKLPTADAPNFALARYVLLGGLLLLWTAETTLTALSWSDPLLLAQTLAARAPQSPRAQYELGRIYVIYSDYEPSSPFVPLAQSTLENAATLPGSSVLPEQALIFMNSRMHLPIKDAWWDSLTHKLSERRAGVQDESSLGALTQCAREGKCELPPGRMVQAYLAALSHPSPSARLTSMYADYAWNVLDEHALGLRMAQASVKADEKETAYRVTLIRMLVAEGQYSEARHQIDVLATYNIGGRLTSTLRSLNTLLTQHSAADPLGSK